jgi:hypothetical protein
MGTGALHVHSKDWTICIPKQNEPGILSVGQCVCIKTNKSTKSLTNPPFQSVRSWGWRYWSPFHCAPQSVLHRFKGWNALPRVLSLYVLTFLSVAELGAMCLVTKEYQLLRIQRLEQCGLGGLPPATLNQSVRLHQLCMDELYIYQRHVRITREIADFV